MPEGSWKCEKCNNINYPFRTKCNRPNCGEEKPLQINDADALVTDQDNQFLSCNIGKLFSKLQFSHDSQDNSDQIEMDLTRHTAGPPLSTSSRSLRMAALSELQNRW